MSSMIRKFIVSYGKKSQGQEALSSEFSSSVLSGKAQGRFRYSPCHLQHASMVLGLPHPRSQEGRAAPYRTDNPDNAPWQQSMSFFQSGEIFLRSFQQTSHPSSVQTKSHTHACLNAGKEGRGGGELRITVIGQGSSGFALEFFRIAFFEESILKQKRRRWQWMLDSQSRVCYRSSGMTPLK